MYVGAAAAAIPRTSHWPRSSSRSPGDETKIRILRKAIIPPPPAARGQPGRLRCPHARDRSTSGRLIEPCGGAVDSGTARTSQSIDAAERSRRATQPISQIRSSNRVSTSRGRLMPRSRSGCRYRPRSFRDDQRERHRQRSPRQLPPDSDRMLDLCDIGPRSEQWDVIASFPVGESSSL